MNNKTVIIISIIFLSACSSILHAQKYSVSSFKILTNDVSAFIEPIRDLNDEDCALIKVQANKDFAFSTPLGIVKRIDKIGEIWLYIPRGSKMITLKHPEWGVIRDYTFPQKIESHIAYELRIKEPEINNPDHKLIETIVVRDTLVLTHIDTLVVKPVMPPTPLTVGCNISAAFGGSSKTLTGGVMISIMKKHGGYVHLLSDFGRNCRTIANCDKFGYVDSRMPYYSGKKNNQCLLLNIGAIHRISKRFCIYEGLGYSYNKTSWELAPSEGGGFVKNSYYSQKGVSFEIGTEINIKNFILSASAISIGGTQWYGAISVGYRINLSKNRL